MPLHGSPKPITDATGQVPALVYGSINNLRMPVIMALAGPLRHGPCTPVGSVSPQLTPLSRVQGIVDGVGHASSWLMPDITFPEQRALIRAQSECRAS